MNWYPRKSKSKNKIKNFIFEKTTEHPLKLDDEHDSKSSAISIQTVAIEKGDWIDPLSAALHDMNKEKSDSPVESTFTLLKNKRSYLGDDFEKWETVVNSITNKSIPIVKSIKRRALLSENPSMLKSDIKFIQNLTDLKSDVIEAWQSNSRVKALRIVCLAVENLTKIERFDLYLYKFVMCTRIVDEFNDLIYQRIEQKVKETNNIEIAKLTCTNWSHKICSVYELLPRLYLEIATLNTFGTFFVYDTTDKLMRTIQRLIETVRGVAEPFEVAFVYTYLLKTVFNIFPDKKEIYFQIFSDFLNRTVQIQEIDFFLPQYLLKIDYNESNETCPYLNHTQHYSIPLDWIFKCLLYKADYEQSVTVYQELNVRLSHHQSSNLFFVIFNQMLPKLNSQFVIENHTPIIELIKTILIQNPNENLPRYQLAVNLSVPFLNDHLTISKISKEEKLLIFKEVWKVIKIMNEKDYIICTNSWIDFAIKHFNMNQIYSILNSIIKHVISHNEFVNCNDGLIQILIKILNSSTINYQQFLTSDIFVPFIEMFQKESTKVAACKTVIEHLIKSIAKGDEHLNYSDSEYMSILIYINKTMHDSVDQLTSEEERRELSNLISEFINLVKFDTYAENLDFLVQCRSLFSFENVIIQLVFNVNKLSLDYSNEEGNQLNSNSFLKACFAFACITIPSVDDEVKSAMLYLNSAQIALRCGFIEQTEFFVRSAICTLDLVSFEKLSKAGELYFVGYIKSILSFLVLVPDDLSKGYLYLFKKLLKTVFQINFKQADHKISIYLSMLDFLYTMALPEYPYHMENIESNDITLLNDEQEFEKTIVQLANSIVEKILEYLESLGLAKEYQRQSNLAFDCFYSLLNNGQWTTDNWKLLFNMWQLAIKNSLSDPKTIRKSIAFTRQRSVNFDDKFLDDLADKLQDHYLKTKFE